MQCSQGKEPRVQCLNAQVGVGLGGKPGLAPQINVLPHLFCAHQERMISLQEDERQCLWAWGWSLATTPRLLPGLILQTRLWLSVSICSGIEALGIV